MSTPSRDEITSQLIETLSTHLDIPREEIKRESALVDDLGLDSFAIVELLFELESSTGIDLPDDEIGDVRTVGHLADCIQEKMAKGNAGSGTPPR